MAERKAILLRISADVADAIQRWAADELRSVNGQIEYVLREAVRKRLGARVSDRMQQQGPTLWEVMPWAQSVGIALRDYDLAEWADRLDKALRYDQPEQDAIVNTQTVLRELLLAIPAMPTELQSVVEGMLKSLDRVAAARGLDWPAARNPRSPPGRGPA
jgi:hypothetical protein